MGEEFRPVAPIDPANLRPLLFLDVVHEIMLSPEPPVPDRPAQGRRARRDLDEGVSERAAGAIELDTFGVGCGDHVKVILQTKVCGAFGCNYQDVASATYSTLPMNGAEVFPVISAPLRSGTNRYRLEVDGTKYVWDGDDGPGLGFAGFVPETDSVYTPGVQLTS